MFSFSFRSRETFSKLLISENLFLLFFLSSSIIDIIYSKIKSRVSFDEETRRLILIAFDSIRVTAIVVNLWLRNTCTRNTDEKEDRINVSLYVRHTIWISFQIPSNLNSPIGDALMDNCWDRITFFNFGWNESAIRRFGGRANGDKFDQFVSPRIEIAEISTRHSSKNLLSLSLSFDSFQRDNFFSTHPPPSSRTKGGHQVFPSKAGRSRFRCKLRIYKLGSPSAR